jgi:hypothetical protein
MTEMVHEHDWTDWQVAPAPGLDGILKKRRHCTEWMCHAVEIRPVLDTALGRCQTMVQCHREAEHAGDHEAREARST